MDEIKNDLPTWREMFGFAPNFTGGLSSSDYVRRQRGDMMCEPLMRSDLIKYLEAHGWKSYNEDFPLSYTGGYYDEWSHEVVIELYGEDSSADEKSYKLDLAVNKLARIEENVFCTVREMYDKIRRWCDG